MRSTPPLGCATSGTAPTPDCANPGTAGATFVPAPSVPLARRTPRSFQTDDLGAIYDALRNLGAIELPAPVAQVWRLSWEGGLAMAYKSGAIVLGGPTPGPLGQLLDHWAANSPDPWQPQVGRALW